MTSTPPPGRRGAVLKSGELPADGEPAVAAQAWWRSFMTAGPSRSRRTRTQMQPTQFGARVATAANSTALPILDFKVKNGASVLAMGRPKQFDPDAAVEQAMEVFWRKGYAGTTPQDLVDALGIGKGSLYNTFGSKHALFEQALRRYRDSQAVVLVEMLEEPGPVKARLRKALGFLAEMDLADPDRRGCMAVNTAAELAGTDQAATELVQRMFARTEDAFRVLIEEGQRSGEIAPGRDSAALGSLLLNTVVGLRLMARVAEGPDRLARVIDATVDCL